MFPPFITHQERLLSSGQTSAISPNLFPRKGGGGGGKSSSSSSKSSSSTSTGSIKTGYNSGKGVAFSSSSKGSKEVKTVKTRGPLNGFQVGGGTRDKVYGTSIYGSGYLDPNRSAGVDKKALPFHFYPIVWPVTSSEYYPTYIHANPELYGSVDNSTRPGGALSQFSLSAIEAPSYTLRIVTDDASSHALYDSLKKSCASGKTAAFQISSPAGFNSFVGFYPTPAAAIQYYRASSVVLTLDGYNNSVMYNDAVLLSDPPTPLPVALNKQTLDCVNSTIGKTVPLVGSSGLGLNDIVGIASGSVVGLVFLVYVIYLLVTERRIRAARHRDGWRDLSLQPREETNDENLASAKR